MTQPNPDLLSREKQTSPQQKIYAITSPIRAPVWR
jgi:hypothetical protein